MKHFRFYSKQDILSLTNIRRFETKLGERIRPVPDPAKFEEYLKTSTAKYVLFGVPEDIGVRANHGIPELILPGFRSCNHF
jgi:formiminoglutamase